MNQGTQVSTLTPSLMPSQFGPRLGEKNPERHQMLNVQSGNLNSEGTVAAGDIQNQTL